MRLPGTLFLWIFAAAVASGQSALVREGDPFPPGPAGQIYSSFNVTAVGSGLGYACSFTSAGPGGFVQGVWGSLDGGAGDVLRAQSMIANLTQTGIESFFGIGDTMVAYSATVTDAGGTPNLDSVWIDDQLLGLNNQQAPSSTDFLDFASRPGMTSTNLPFYIAGLSATSGGPNIGRALYLGTSAIYRTGDVVPNMPAPLSTAAVDFDFRFSSDGSHHIAPLALEGSVAEDAVMALDGAGLVLGGALVREGQPVPASLGGPVEAWERFDFCGVSNAGDYMFTGDTSAPVGEDEFIIRNGAFWAREGDMIDGFQVVGGVESATLSALGDIAFIWSIVDPVEGNLEALYHGTTLMLKEGDPVDWDGDGSIDLNTAITNFNGINPITLSSAGMLYFTAEVDVAGTALRGYFAMEVDGIGTNYCMANPNSTGAPATISAQGSAEAGTNQLFLRASSMPAFAFGFFVVSDTQGFSTNPGGSAGNLCLDGSIGRYQNLVQSSGALGSIAIQTDLSSIPQPLGAVATLPGDTWNFQTWFRDQGPSGTPTSNFSDAIEVTFF